MFEDDNTTFCAIPVRSIFSMLQKSSFSKACFNFGLTLSLDESEENKNPEGNKITSPRLKTTIDDDPENPTQGDKNSDDKGHDDSDDDDDVDDKKSESSFSDTGSSDENIVDPFSLLELRDNVYTTNSKVDKATKKVTSLDSKLTLVIKSLSKIKATTPLELDLAN